MFAGGRGGVNSRGGGYSGGGAISRGRGTSGGVNGNTSDDDQSSRDTGSNSLGVGGHGTGLAADGVGVTEASGGVRAGDGSGLNPNRTSWYELSSTKLRQLDCTCMLSCVSKCKFSQWLLIYFTFI